MTEPLLPAADDQAALHHEIEALRREVDQLRRDHTDLETALQTTAAHGDAVEGQLQEEILERQRAEAALQAIVEVVSRKNVDLEIILQMTAEHGDIIENELRRASQAKTVFLSTMSHELRTPLNAIIGFAQLMNREPDQTAERRRHLDIILRSGEHLLNLINDILSLSKIEAGKLTLTEHVFNLNQMLKNVEDMMSARAGTKGLEFRFEMAPSVPDLVIGDEGRLRQVLINLLGNAVKFTAQGSVLLYAAWSGGRASFAVTDTGQGVAPDEMETLFTPFTQTSTGVKSKEGTGLGLAISRELALLMGGDIRVSSEINAGSTFSLEINLPTAPEREVIRSEFQAIGLAPGQKTPKALIVDDNSDHRLLLTQLLESVGVQVSEATNGKEGVALWQSGRPDILFLNIRMPEMTGDRVARRIRELEVEFQLARTPIIAASASVFDQDRALMAEAGCDGFLPKPFRESEVFQKLAEQLGVIYLYADTQTGTRSEVLTRERYQALPAAWREQFEYAVASGNPVAIEELLKQIEAADQLLTQEIRKVAKIFDFSKLEKLFIPNA